MNGFGDLEMIINMNFTHNYTFCDDIIEEWILYLLPESVLVSADLEVLAWPMLGWAELAGWLLVSGRGVVADRRGRLNGNTAAPSLQYMVIIINDISFCLYLA